ncbi:uncharacterized protein TNCV_4723891 [Trichonephila clavipes]|uniref:Uncharacterized protein n=1 Tax=Trichonephila clavipes TaxID=2585209 RepID=A0A8X6W7U3_TRICX|nr:uncharacterized protein TNCV_4723891 [Trichonephila clavipes]
MGKMKMEKERHSNVLLSLHVSDNCIKDLWSLDVLGIKDPFEKKTRIELEEAAKDPFARHVTRDADGRYVVSLPWSQGHPFLSNCRNLAERRLKNCVRSLERSKNLRKYEAVFTVGRTKILLKKFRTLQIRRMNTIYRNILYITIIPLPKLDRCLMDRRKKRILLR